MRRAAVLIGSLVMSTPAIADPEIRVDAGMTGSVVGASGRNGGGLVGEIKAYANDSLAIGGRLEVAMMFGGVFGEDELPLDVGLAACGLVKAEYYVLPGQVRPFVGFGAGAYTLGSQRIESGPNTSGINTQTGNYFGVAPQLGVDLWRFRLAATYNMIVGASIEYTETGPTREMNRLSRNYFSLEASFRFGSNSTRGARRDPGSASK
jgi:hypothetical protein